MTPRHAIDNKNDAESNNKKGHGLVGSGEQIAKSSMKKTRSCASREFHFYPPPMPHETHVLSEESSDVDQLMVHQPNTVEPHAL